MPGIRSSKPPTWKDVKRKAGSVKPRRKLGPTFAPERTLRQMRDLHLREKISETSAVFLAAVLETIATDLVKAAGNTMPKRNQYIKTQDLANAILNDGDYQTLARDVQKTDG